MAERTIVQDFEKWYGLDYKRSKLTRQVGYFESLQNYEHGEGYALRGRPGGQPIGQAGGFLGQHTYSYLDKETGATTEQLLTINSQLWRLATSSISPTRGAGSATWNWKVTLDTGSSAYRFVLTQGGVALTLVHQITSESNAYLNLGTGLELDEAPTVSPTTGVITIMDLAQAIEAHANFTCALPTATGRVNGNQTNVTAITIDAGHTFSARQMAIFYDYASAQLVSRLVKSTTATTITFDALSPGVTVKNDQVIGIGAVPAATIPINPSGSTVADPAQTISFSYWEPIPGPLGEFYHTIETSPFYAFQKSHASTYFKPPCLINADQNCYIYTNSPSIVVFDVGGVAATTRRLWDGYPFKYDGKNCYRAGVPPYLAYCAPTDSGNAGNVDGTVKYSLRFAQLDGQGVTRYGNPSHINEEQSVTIVTNQVTLTIDSLQWNVDPVDRHSVNGNQVAVTTITVNASHPFVASDWIRFLDRSTGNDTLRIVTGVTATTVSISGAAVDVNNNDAIVRNPPSGFNHGGGIVNGGQAGVTTITIDNTHNFRVGDICSFINRTTEKIVHRVVDSLTDTTITISGTAVNVSDNDYITKGTTIEIYRTVNGGNKYYFADEIPNPIFDRAFTYTDNLADSGLTFELDEPINGRELDLPPRASVACVHQGVIVSSGSDEFPNTIYKSLSENIEAVSLQEGYFDVPATVKGNITGVFSDTDDRLLAFKNLGIYKAEGSVDDSAPIVTPLAEGDWGVSSQASLAKVRGIVIGVGPHGVIGVKNGDVLEDEDGDSLIGGKISPAFINNTNIALSKAVACNDSTTRHYRLYVPSTTEFDGADTAANALHFVLDYARMFKWFNHDHYAGLGPDAGMGVYSNNLYYLSRHSTVPSSTQTAGHFHRRHNQTQDVSQNYADNTLAIDYDMKTQPYHFDLVSIDKEFLWFKIYSFYSDFDSDQFVACTYTVTTYGNFQSSSTWDSFTEAFAAATTFEQRQKLRAGKFRALQFRVRVNTIHSCPHISGFEHVISFAYDKDEFKP